MKNTQEIWKDIAGYEGLYQVSNFGRVRSLNYRRRKGLVHILRAGRQLNGYLYVYLGRHVNGKWEGKTHRIHRLVASAFIPNPENKSEIDHCDGNINNNWVGNLRWVTTLENMNNPITKARIKAIQTPEHRAKLSALLKGRKFSEEHLEHIRLVHRSEEYRKHMSEVMRGSISKWRNK